VIFTRRVSAQESLAIVMKCPRCGFNSFDYLEKCKRCGEPLEVNPRYRILYKPETDTRIEEEVIIVEDIASVDEKEDLNAITDQDSMEVNEEAFEDEESEATEIDVIDEIVPNKNAGEPLELAGFFSRFIAFIIDSLIIFGTTILVLIIGIISGLDASDVGSDSFTNYIVPVFLSLLFLCSSYFVFLIGYGGKTIGMVILDIRVIEDDGSSIDLYRAFLRWIASYVSASFLFIGYLWAIFDAKSQTWHDKIAHTLVISE